ncbi:LacI family DNA-binding transcriptional regulator [Gorillibacterium sp. sgz500922]|uniref:LacI family DNA-binding transcriptional regulator n=1 Tax=Gorillibacterium sp. sgz500922 TaxID=3446694 RepID=UPI003F6732BB
MDKKIVDVARLSGVSTATVSRVLNNSGLVAEKTRTKVLQAIEQLNYYPNAAAKHLRSQRTRAIGVVVQDINISFFSEIIKGIQNAAFAEQYRVIVCDADNSPAKELEYLDLLLNRTVDAMILVSCALPDEVLDELAAKGHRIGLVCRQSRNPLIPSCITNNVEFSAEVVRHLAEMGHRRIAYISGTEGNTDSQDRMEGFIRSLAERGLAFDPLLAENGRFNEAGGYAAMKRLIAKGLPFTAVYAANDEIGLGVYKACREAGLRIPEDIAVVGVDNNRITEYIEPAMSTVSQPKYRLGAELTGLLIRRMEHPSEEDGVTVRVLESELIVRKSSNYQRD